MKKLAWLAAFLFATTLQAQVVEPIVDRQAMEVFGESIARAFNERDLEAASALIDVKGLGVRAARFMELKPSDEADYVRGLESVGTARLLGGLFKSLEAGEGSVQFMRVTDTRPMRALIRFDLGDNGFDYLEFVVDGRSGRPRAVDWFQLSTGQLLSVTIGGIGQLFTTSDPSLLGRLLDIKNVDKAQVATLRRIGELHRANKHAEAVALFHQLPEQTANARIMLTLRAQYAAFAEMQAEYESTLATMAKRYSDDPATAFMLIDHYFTVKDYPKALTALEAVEKRVGKDGVTTMLRATVYFVSGDFANMLKYSEESIGLEPDRIQGYDTRATALVGLERHAAAVAAYRDMESRFDLKFTREIFAADPAFGKFMASDDFRKWLPR